MEEFFSQGRHVCSRRMRSESDSISELETDVKKMFVLGVEFFFQMRQAEMVYVVSMSDSESELDMENTCPGCRIDFAICGRKMV
jgi:hypothetical protein